MSKLKHFKDYVCIHTNIILLSVGLRLPMLSRNQPAYISKLLLSIIIHSHLIAQKCNMLGILYCACVRGAIVKMSNHNTIAIKTIL